LTVRMLSMVCVHHMPDAPRKFAGVRIKVSHGHKRI